MVLESMLYVLNSIFDSLTTMQHIAAHRLPEAPTLVHPKPKTQQVPMRMVPVPIRTKRRGIWVVEDRLPGNIMKLHIRSNYGTGVDNPIY